MSPEPLIGEPQVNELLMVRYFKTEYPQTPYISGTTSISNHIKSPSLGIVHYYLFF